MPNLVQEFGAGYFRDKFSGTYFLDSDGKVNMIQSQRTDSASVVQVTKIGGSRERINKTTVNMAADDFQSMEMFKGPRLGWRCAAAGKFLALFHRNNQSYAKGYNSQNIKFTPSPLTKFLSTYGSFNLDYYQQPEVRGRLAMDPEYMTMAEGLSQMNAGKRVAFALNPDVAVVVNNQESHALLGRAGQIGTVSIATGEINLSIPFNPALLENA